VNETQKAVILSKIETAQAEVGESVRALDELLAALASAPRAEKTTVTKVVEDAFSRLNGARASLTEVIRLLG
jgi:hypothetical protein